MMKKHRRELEKRVADWELEVLGYKVDRAQQIENIFTLTSSVVFFMSIILYLEYMPKFVEFVLL